MRNPIECPHCKRTMVVGYVAERGHFDQLREMEWSEGPPVQGWLLGLKKAEVVRTLRAYRCNECGLVQFFAH